MTSLRVVHSDARFSRKTRPQPSRAHAHAQKPLIPANLPPIAPHTRRNTSPPRKNATEAIDFQWFINEKQVPRADGLPEYTAAEQQGNFQIVHCHLSFVYSYNLGFVEWVSLSGCTLSNPGSCVHERVRVLSV